jgi:DNA-3-methyladenine glycosylase II
MMALYGNSPRLPKPQELLDTPDTQLRAAGLSGNKTAALKDLAAKALDGIVPTHKEIHGLPDSEIIERLTQIRGIGPWTVEMMLMFQLGRADVLPVTDYGVRSGFALTYGLKDLPSPKELLAHGERWRPYRSVASWYLWRAADLAKADLARAKSELPRPKLAPARSKLTQPKPKLTQPKPKPAPKTKPPSRKNPSRKPARRTKVAQKSKGK